MNTNSVRPLRLLATVLAIVAIAATVVLVRSDDQAASVEVDPAPSPAVTTTVADAATADAYPTTEPEPAPAVDYPTAPTSLANAATGEVLGLPIGSASADVVAALTAEFGAIDQGEGWFVPCDAEELNVTAGGFFFRFVRDEAGDRLVGWSTTADQDAFQRVELPSPVDHAMSMVELAASLDEDLQVIPDWDSSRIWVTGPTTNPFFISTADTSLPAQLIGHGSVTADCYDY